MKKYLLFLLILIFSLSAFASTGIARADTSRIVFEALSPEPQHRNVSRLICELLLRNHYKKRKIDDSLSSEMLDRYIKRLDYNRIYFLASDIESFEKYRYMFDDFVRSGQLNAAYEIFTVYQQRAAERLQYVFKRLNHDFDFTIDEYMEVDRENAPWANTRQELDELWRKRLKNAALSLKLAGKDWEGVQKTLRKRYKRIQRNIEQFQSEDVFQIVMNALSQSFDPHTDYLSPKTYDNFKIRMSQSLEGIGARLTTEDEFTVVSDIVSGGPADKGGLLHAKDKIIGVGQGVDGEIVDVVGWRIDDVVQLIRGKKGTVVRLVIIPSSSSINSPPDTISIVRDKIKLEDQSASSDTLRIKHQGRMLTFGVLDIPSFYSDFDAMRRGDKNYKSTTHDVKKLLDELKTKNIDGIIIDLRHNGGGYLNEAVSLTGLFIDQGPVVQVRDSHGRVKLERDMDRSVAYNGPLIVIVDRLSASASEIFAAAIQDYGRGIITGTQSFGKGTVQNAIDLNRYYRQSPVKLGQLKLTVAKFYRVNGGSTQNVGVMPNIAFPSRYDFSELGESSEPNALLWDQINPVDHEHFFDLSTIVPQLETQHELRVTKNPDYKKLLEEIEKIKREREKTEISLNEEKRREERRKSGDNAEKDEQTASADSTDNPEVPPQKVKVKKGLVMKESAHILSDFIMLTEKEHRSTAIDESAVDK